MGCGCKRIASAPNTGRRNGKLTDVVRRIAESEDRVQIIYVDNGVEKTESLDCYIAGCAENGKYGIVTGIIFP